MNECCNNCNNIGYLDEFNGCTYPNCDCHKPIDKETKEEHYQSLVDTGLSDYEARATVWPEKETWESAYRTLKFQLDLSAEEETYLNDFVRILLASQKEKMLGVLEGRMEALAEIEHEQWILWSKNIAETETITPARLERWQKLWRPYSELTEEEKDQDKEWANKVISDIKKKIGEL